MPVGGVKVKPGRLCKDLGPQRGHLPSLVGVKLRRVINLKVRRQAGAAHNSGERKNLGPERTIERRRRDVL